MLGFVFKVATEAIEAAGSVVGVRRGTEEPLHAVEQSFDGVEIRRYGLRIAAETTVTGLQNRALSEGFRRLARYIFGGNHVRAEIATTAPVTQQPSVAYGRQRSEKLAMTAPVSQHAEGDDQWVVRFFMPAGKTTESLPEPDDAAVKLVTIPAETLAVRRFSSTPSPKAVASQTDELMYALRNRGFEATGTPAAWFYDPPWTLPMLRRNEIAVPVEAKV
jgi:hypothetical protein